MPDLVLTFTGGGANVNPDSSLGGEPSVAPILTGVDNLFDDISTAEAAAGYTDFRCVYVWNNTPSTTFSNVALYTQAAGESQIELAVFDRTEVQTLTVFGTLSGGHFTVSYTPPGGILTTETVNYNSSSTLFASNLETAINLIPTLNCTVSAVATSGQIVFTINFADFRGHDLLVVNTSSLTGSGISASIIHTIYGSPINAIPDSIDVPTTTPFQVISDFVNYDSLSTALDIGVLYPGEGFPLWLERILRPGSPNLENDGFVLTINTN